MQTMTHDKRIEAMLIAFYNVADSGMWTYGTAMEAALAAAGVEEMVREAVMQGVSLGWDLNETRMGEKEYEARKSDIVREVMGK